MKKLYCLFLAMLLTFCLCLSGCSQELPPWLRLQDNRTTSFDQMQYTRPDPDALQKSLEDACALIDAGDADKALNGIFAFYDAYDLFSTNSNLAFIYYCKDITDTHWQKENDYCTQVSPLLEVTLDQLYQHIADSSLRQELEENYFGEDFFTYYADATDWDETLTTLLEEEAALVEEYYALSQETEDFSGDVTAYYDAYYEPMANLYIKLILKRQELAAAAGYDDYATFAFENYHFRSYPPYLAELYLTDVGQYFSSMYRLLTYTDYLELVDCTTEETFSYVQAATTAMGGTVAEAFNVLQTNNLYDIDYSLTKYPGSFETYLWSYNVPYVFVDTYLDQADKLAFAHEFGHFANDYACFGSYAGTDVAEVHSQAFEYLSLCYTENSEELTQYKLAESICTYTEQAAYSLFELEAYMLSPEELTPEGLLELYHDFGAYFGLYGPTWDEREFITIPHFFTQPMYMLSYVVSNDLALQIYEMELTEAGSGLALYQACLEGEQEDPLLFAAEYNLADPLSTERVEAAAAFLEEKVFP